MFHITVRIAALWQMSFSSSCYGQPTRLMLRLCLIQHGTHFLSDLMPGEAGAWTAEACFLQKQGTEVEILEEQVWLSFGRDTGLWIIQSRLLLPWSLLTEHGVITVHSEGRLGLVIALSAHINNVTVISRIMMDGYMSHIKVTSIWALRNNWGFVFTKPNEADWHHFCHKMSFMQYEQTYEQQISLHCCLREVLSVLSRF